MSKDGDKYVEMYQEILRERESRVPNLIRGDSLLPLLPEMTYPTKVSKYGKN
jgi:hypothetical protein